MSKDEFRSCIEGLRGHEDKIKIVLNKADLVDHQVSSSRIDLEAPMGKIKIVLNTKRIC